MFHSFLAVEPAKKKTFDFKFTKLQRSVDKLNELSGSVGDNNVNNGESKTEDPSSETGTINLNSLIDLSLHYIQDSEIYTHQRINLIGGYFKEDLLETDRAPKPTNTIKKIITLTRNKEKTNIFTLKVQLYAKVLELHKQYKSRLSQDNNPPFIKTFKDMEKIDEYLSWKLNKIHKLYVNYNKNYKQDKCQYGRVDDVRPLLAPPGIQLNQARDDGVTPLIIACSNGHTDVVRLLLDQKVKKKSNLAGLGPRLRQKNISSVINLIIKNSDTATVKTQEYPDLTVAPPKERQESTYTYTNFDWVSDLPTQARSDLKKWMEDVRTEKGGNLNYQRVASSKTLKDKLRPILKRYRFPQWTIFHEIPENIIRECIQWFKIEGESDESI
tara:strand:+ start:98 stop:1249 length:1152 start_codon:yes stop_codon:yes gene_type:complete